MQRIIKNNEVIDETWHLLPKDATLDGISNCDDLIVPLSLWRDHARALKVRDGGLGVSGQIDLRNDGDMAFSRIRHVGAYLVVRIEPARHARLSGRLHRRPPVDVPRAAGGRAGRRARAHARSASSA